MFMTTSNSTNKALKEGVSGEAQAQFNINDKPSSLPKAFLREMEDLLGDEYQAFLILILRGTRLAGQKRVTTCQEM